MIAQQMLPPNVASIIFLYKPVYCYLTQAQWRVLATHTQTYGTLKKVPPGLSTCKQHSEVSTYEPELIDRSLLFPAAPDELPSSLLQLLPSLVPMLASTFQH